LGYPENEPIFDTVTTYRCRLCPEIFQEFQDLPKHLKSSHSLNTSEVFECSTCRTVFLNKSGLTQHSSQVHGIYEVLKCQFCTASFRYWDGQHLLHAHLAKCHLIKSCATCKELNDDAGSTTGFATFVAHLTEHLVTPKTTPKVEFPEFECNLCQKRFQNNIQKQNHIMNQHKLQCCWCHGTSSFQSKNGLMTHITLIHGIRMPDNNGACPKCSKVVNSVAGFVDHFLGHGVELTTCKLCSHSKNKFYAPEEHRPYHMKMFHGNLARK